MTAVVVMPSVLSPASFVAVSSQTFCSCGLSVYERDQALHAAVVACGFVIALVVMFALMRPGAVVPWCQSFCGCSVSGNSCDTS